MRKGWRWGLVVAGVLAVAGCSEAPSSDVAFTQPGAPPRSGVRIEMREADTVAQAGSVPARTLDGTPIHLVGPPVITASAIAGVRQEVGPNGLATLYYTFTDAAEPRIQRASERLVGRMMVVSVDGDIISVAHVSAPFGKYMQTTGVEPDDAARLIERMTGTPATP
ncbi:SecDF P1 head subdomain-containing protein [Stenotrophomonas sp. GZD-301]|uniref:SecDF P1 head subdomain-containing protein n=1 Tax=Stenotrophomonas sp. GZD-301 TaxID=3404814 RepID=UPI003BB55995